MSYRRVLGFLEWYPAIPPSLLYPLTSISAQCALLFDCQFHMALDSLSYSETGDAVLGAEFEVQSMFLAI